MKQTSQLLMHKILLYTLGVLLFLEWVYPIDVLGFMGGSTAFILYTIVIFLITLLQLKWWISFLLKGIATGFIIHFLYYQTSLFDPLWIEQFIKEVIHNIGAILSYNLYEVTDLFRNVMLILLIWLMSYLIHYWFVVTKRILTFVVLTIIYIALLDSFTAYDANGAIVRIFIFSFIALGVTSVARGVDKEELSFPWLKKIHAWFLPLLLIVLCATLIGFKAPKLDPIWPDPVPYLLGTTNTDKEDVGKVGYGENDEQLGGDFEADDTPVFEATMTDDHYWRIETKEIYTGKGWETKEDAERTWLVGEHISLDTFNDKVETDRQKTDVYFLGNTEINKLIYPYGTNQVETEKDVDYVLNEGTEAIETRVNNNAVSLESYTIMYDNPSFQIEDLKNANTDDPDHIRNTYTQIPDDLPKRVHELAEDITTSAENRYEQAKAIEQYFGANGFTYQTKGVDVPEEDEDYVDSFLFESRAGYCDNYSTSMVVLLRTLGIPARWAKGFTSGEEIEDSEINHADAEDEDVYEVKNENAHSWVEVYFPSTGWVPFEPTQGFSNLADFHEEGEESIDDFEEDEADQIEEEEREEALEDEAEMELDKENSLENERAASKEENSLHLFVKIAIGILIIVVSSLLYYYRFHLHKKYILYKWNKRQDEQSFEEAYHFLLKVLKHRIRRKKLDETLTEYALVIDEAIHTKEMGKLTKSYVEMLYNDEKFISYKEQMDLFDKVLKQVLSSKKVD